MAPARGITVNGAAIRAIREAKGWKLSQFASKAEVSTGYLSNIEIGRKPRVAPDVETRIADLLQVPQAAITSPHFDVVDVA